PRPINGKIMFSISFFGFGVNLILMKADSHGGDDHGHSHGDDNVAVQAALAHVIGDIVQSLGVCLAALCIWLQPLDVGTVWTSRGEVSRWNYAARSKLMPLRRDRPTHHQGHDGEDHRNADGQGTFED
ncbi:Zinc transporter 4 (ZnT-4) (Dri 27 protein) (Solute carrier family 30 member 4), partial [Durusdinium trenchii]